MGYDLNMRLFNTYLISVDTFSATRKLASEATRADATYAEDMNSRNLNSLDYFVQSYEVGSERDLECLKDLKKIERQK